MSFSSDGQTLASASDDRTVRLWEVAGGQEKATLQGYTSVVHSVSISPDGQTLASGSLDGTVWLWDMSPYVTLQTPVADFDNDGSVGFGDFLQFAAQFGLSQGDAGFDARFDLDGDGFRRVQRFSDLRRKLRARRMRLRCRPISEGVPWRKSIHHVQEGNAMSACPSCNTDYAAGARWCSICHTNVVNPEIGRLASPGKRLGAYIVDYLVLTLIVTLYYIGAAVGEYAGIGALSTMSVVLLVVFAGLSLYLFAKGMTIGKKLLGMRVAKEDGRPAGFLTMLIREWIGKLVSAVVLSLGFVWILIDKENQGWHDKLMRTYVVSD